MAGSSQVDEIGYQRKGMSGFTSEFPDVDDDGILTLFTKNDVEKLMDFVNDDTKYHFRTEILDKFKDGKTFLWLWW